MKILKEIKKLAEFDLAFSLDFKVISLFINFFRKFVIGLKYVLMMHRIFFAVSDSENLRFFLNRNTFFAFFIAISTSFCLYDIYIFETFSKKFLILTISTGMMETTVKVFAVLFNMKSFRRLKQIILNEDGHFESEMAIELPYRKVMRLILVTMLGIEGPAVFLFAYFMIAPFQLPFTR